MKPPRGKRVDPQSRLAEFSSDGRCGRWVRDVIALSCCSALVSRVHFPRAERHDRFPVGQKAVRKVGGRFGVLCYSLACPDPAGDRGAAVGRGHSALLGSSTGRDWATVSADCFLGWSERAWLAQGQWRIGRPSTRPVLKHGPRSLACARVVG